MITKPSSVEQRELARNATEWMAGPYGLPKTIGVNKEK